MEEQTEIILKITKSKHDEWSKFAKKGVSLHEYVQSSVEEKSKRKNMIDFLEIATSYEPFEEKKFYKY